VSIQAERNYGLIVTLVLSIGAAIVVGALMLIRGDDDGNDGDAAQTPPAETR